MQPPKPLGLVHNTTAQNKNDSWRFDIFDSWRFSSFFSLVDFSRPKKKHIHSFIHPCVSTIVMLIIQPNDLKWIIKVNFFSPFPPSILNTQRQLLVFHYIEKNWFCFVWVRFFFKLGVFCYCYICLGLYWVIIYVDMDCLYIECFYFWGVCVVWGGAWHIKCPRDLFTNRGSVGLTSVDRRTSLLSHLQYPVP